MITPIEIFNKFSPKAQAKVLKIENRLAELQWEKHKLDVEIIKMKLTERVGNVIVLKTCLNRFIGRCKECKRDYENHHPNNLDCPDYKEIYIDVFEVKKR